MFYDSIQGRYRRNLTMSTKNCMSSIGPANCSPTRFTYVFENGPVSVGQCATNQCFTIYNATYSSVRCVHNNKPQYLSELFIPVAKLPGRCHDHPVTCSAVRADSVYKDHRPSWIFILAWNNLHPVLVDPLLSFLTFKHLLKTKHFL